MGKMKRGFQRWLDGDGYGNGSWGRHIAGGQYHVIYIVDMDDACGRDNEGQPKYCVELYLVDADVATDKQTKEAVQSCGYEGLDLKDKRVVAELLFEYGVRAPLNSITTNSRDKGFREARKLSYELSGSEQLMEARMNRPVNAIGSTAREYMQGDIFAAMERGVEKGDPKAKLMAKIYGVPENIIKAVEEAGPPKPTGVDERLRYGRVYRVDLSRLTRQNVTDDPLPYWAGWADGHGGLVPEGPRDKVTQAYLDGYKKGVAVRLGQEPKPEWLR